MGDLKNEDTSYPASLDTRTLIADSTDDVVAAHVNGLASAIIALETELGVNPAGSVTDIVTRLAVNLHDDGGVLRGTSFPVSPPLKPHLFWRTDLKQLYMYDTSIAQYQRVDATNVHASLAALDADDHTQYVHNTTARTITAQHTFNPGSALPPFILHANAQGQKVIGLDAETVDGKNPGSASGLATLDGSSLVVEDPANATATKTAGKICKWGTSEAFQCSALTATTISGTQLTSTIATGTAPLVVTSTTEVANLHSDVATNINGNTEYSATAASDAVSVNVGTVTAGDRILVTCVVSGTWDTLPTYEYYYLTLLGGSTATIQIGYDSISAMWGTTQSNTTTRSGSITLLVKVTGSGSCTLLNSHSIASAGANPVYSSKIHALFLNRQ